MSVTQEESILRSGYNISDGGEQTIHIITFLCPSACPFVMGGQWKQFDIKTQKAVSLAIQRYKVKLGSLHASENSSYRHDH